MQCSHCLVLVLAPVLLIGDSCRPLRAASTIHLALTALAGGSQLQPVVGSMGLLASVVARVCTLNPEPPGDHESNPVSKALASCSASLLAAAMVQLHTRSMHCAFKQSLCLQTGAVTA